MLLPDPRKAIFRGAEQRSWDQVFFPPPKAHPLKHQLATVRTCMIVRSLILKGGENGQQEKVRVRNWILLHGDKKNTAIQRITQQRTLKFPHLREQGAILRYLDVDISADHPNNENCKVSTKVCAL